MAEANKPAEKKKHGRIKEAAEHVVDAVRDRVREIELGLDEGDHTVIGELSGVIEEVAHPEGEEDGRPARKR